jgi:hypothetical protein
METCAELPASAPFRIRRDEGGVPAMTRNVVSLTNPTTADREPTLFDSLSRLVPDDLQAAYYRVLAHTVIPALEKGDLRY